MSPIEKLLGNPGPFLTKVFHYLSNDGIDVAGFPLDHICYRVEAQGRYFFLKRELEKLGELHSESEISGRLIATFQLNSPIQFRGREIFLLELPSPKPGSPYREGFEHVEFAIGQPLAGFVAQYPHIGFDMKGFSKKTNPDVRIGYGELSVKFHEHDLAYVIRFLD